MSKVYAFTYRKENGSINDYVVLEKEHTSEYLKGLDILDGGQFKTFKAGGFCSSRVLLDTDDSQIVDYQVLTLDDLCKRVNFHPGHVNLVGMNNFLKAANGTLVGGKKVIQLRQDKFLLYGSNIRQVSIYNSSNGSTLILSVGTNGTPITASLAGKVLTNDEIFAWGTQR